MTIRDLLDAGIMIQGKVFVRLFVDDEEKDEQEIADEAFYMLPVDYLDKEIHYMYAVDDVGSDMNVVEGAGLVIEIMDYTD